MFCLVDGGYGYQQVGTKFRGDYPRGEITNDKFSAFNGVTNGNSISAVFVLENRFYLANAESIQGGCSFGRQYKCR